MVVQWYSCTGPPAGGKLLVSPRMASSAPAQRLLHVCSAVGAQLISFAVCLSLRNIFLLSPFGARMFSSM